MIYQYECDNCGKNFEIQQSIHDKSLTKCPQCKKNKLYRIIFAPYIINHTEPSNVVSLAERNTSKMGKYELETKRRKDSVDRRVDTLSQKLPRGAEIVKRKDTKAPWWRPGTDRPIDLKKIKNVKKYIETGNKD